MPDDIWTLAQYQAYLASGATPRPAPAAPTAAEVSAGLLGAVRSGADRYRSQTERRYAHWLTARQAAGELRQWWYEPFKGLYLAPQTSVSPDFLVEHMAPGLMLELHEVKGPFINPASWQKLKQAAALYTCFRFVLAQWKHDAWHQKEIPAL